MKNILILLADNFEEIEVITPLDLWRRAGLNVTLASISSEIQVSGQQGLIIFADKLLQNLQYDNFDLLYIPGGNGHILISQSELAMQWIEYFWTKQKHIAAICAAPNVLKSWITTQQVTSYPSFKENFSQWLDQTIVHDHHLITSQGAGTAHLLAFYIIEHFLSPEASAELQTKTIFSHEQNRKHI